MQFGAAIFPTAESIHPAELGKALEERGFESLWVAEHTHIPASRRSPWPGAVRRCWEFLASQVRRSFTAMRC